MIKVFVAEDQPLILKDLCRKIEKSDSQIQIVGSALNGQEAYEKIKESMPDIIFTDIRMPLLSGLDLISRLKKISENFHFVIISGYKDFEYAREAIKLEVFEYLLKPLCLEDIQFVVQNLKKKITTQKSEYAQNVLKSLLSPNYKPYAHINTIFDYNYYYVITLTLGSFPTFCIDYAIPHKPVEEIILIEPLFLHFIKEDEKVYSLPGNSYKEEIYILCLNYTTIETILTIAKEILNEVSKNTMCVTLCISREIKHIDNIGIETQIMRAHVSQHLIFAKSQIIQTDLLSLNTQKIREFLKEETLNKFKHYSENSSFDKFHTELYHLISDLERNNATQKEVELCIKKLFHYCFTYSSNFDSFPFELDIDEYITNSKNYKELFSFLDFLSEQLIKKTAININITDTEKLIEEIKIFMYKNYASDININDIAKIFYLTPAYFSRIFKKYVNKKPIEYLTNIRIQYACQYFETTEFSVKEIAELCGYADQFYFSKIFKAITGKSPSEYRITYKKDIF